MQRLSHLPKLTGQLEILIRLPLIRGDVSNRIKAVEDWLVRRNLTGDDKHNRRVSIETDPDLLGNCCEVLIREAAPN